MPTREAPVDVNEPNPEVEGRTDPDSKPGGETAAAGESLAQDGSGPSLNDAGGRAPAVRGSRWIDYDTHELLEMISQLEDERRWARLREGVLWAILVHIAVLFALFLIPKYVLRLQPAITTDNIRNHKDFTYFDTPYLPPARPVRPLTHQPQIDQKTLEDLKRQAPPAPAPPTPPPPQQVQQPVQPQPQPTQPIPPSPQSQSQVEAPRPTAVPARPNFALDSSNPADQLKHDMQNAMHGPHGDTGQIPMGAAPGHPGAGGGAQIISDTQGVDFNAWMTAWHYETQRTWDPLIPPEVNPPISKQGQVMIRFKVLPNGRLMDGSVVLEGRSGDVALDRAAWGALTGSSYPPLPKDFHGPYIELRAWFLYNLQPPQQ